MSLTVCTMVYDDADFLSIWKRYWTERLPAASLYVFVHGGRPEMMDLAAGTTRIPIARPDPYPDMEKDRWRMLSNMVSGLTYMNDAVVYTDVDEILISDPDGEPDVVKILREGTHPVETPAGIELIHRSDLEPGALDIDGHVLQQRRYVRASNFYCKPSIIRRPVKWVRGGHFSDYENVHFVDGLFNLHLRFMDEGLFRSRAARRRETTATDISINKSVRRQWRVSDDALEGLLSEHRGYPITPDTEDAPATFDVRRPMLKRAQMGELDGTNVRKHLFREAKTLQKLPERFSHIV